MEAKQTPVLPAESGWVGKVLAAVRPLGWGHQQASCGGPGGLSIFLGTGQIMTRRAGWGLGVCTAPKIPGDAAVHRGRGHPSGAQGVVSRHLPHT